VVTTEDYFREKAREAMTAVDSDDGGPNRHAPSSAGGWPITATNSDGSFAYPPRPYAHHMSQGFSSQQNQGIPALQVSPQSPQDMQRQMLQLQQQQQQVQQQQMQLMQQQLQQHQLELRQFRMQQQQQSPQALGQLSQQITQLTPLQPQQQLQQAPPPQSYQNFGNQNQPPPIRMQPQPQFPSFPRYGSEPKLQISADVGQAPISLDAGQTPQQLQFQLQQLQQQQSLVQQQLESVQRQLQPTPTVARFPTEAPAAEIPRLLAIDNL
jgi:hypothetical protein